MKSLKEFILEAALVGPVNEATTYDNYFKPGVEKPFVGTVNTGLSQKDAINAWNGGLYAFSGWDDEPIDKVLPIIKRLDPKAHASLVKWAERAKKDKRPMSIATTSTGRKSDERINNYVFRIHPEGKAIPRYKLRSGEDQYD